jgi:hypothetical protein
MEADMVYTVILADREILAPTRGVHRRMPGEREHAAVVLAAQERGAPVDGELGFRVSELTYAKGHGAFIARFGGRDSNHQPVKVGMELVPGLRARAQRHLNGGGAAFTVQLHLGGRQVHGYPQPVNRASQFALPGLAGSFGHAHSDDG